MPQKPLPHPVNDTLIDGQSRQKAQNMSDLFEVIEDAITDVELPEDTSTAEDTTEPIEAAPEVPETAPETTTEEAPTLEVSSPAALSQEPPKPADEFEKKYGITAQSSSGRENRIPYPRVKKIAEKADKDGYSRAEATFNPKLAEFETKSKEYETKITDYEGRLHKVAEFEHMMLNQPDEFIQMMSQIPAYAERFATKSAPEAPPTEVVDDMPQPDQPLSDGTTVYSLDGLKKLNEWNRAQAKKEVLEDVNKRFGPIEEQWNAHQKVQALIPKVQAQIDEARKWTKFSENEADIVNALKANSTLTLEGAYNQVVIPKILSEIEKVSSERDKAISEKTADHNKVRSQILKELKSTPSSTSAPTQASKPSSNQVSSGPRTLEEVIAESIKGLQG